MSSNSAHIVHQIHQDFKDLVEYVTGKEAQTRTAHEVELTLFRRLLALGAQLLYLFFVQRAADRPPGPVRAPDETRLTGARVSAGRATSLSLANYSSDGTTSMPPGKKESVLWMLN